MTQKRYTEIPKRQKCINKEEPYIGGAKDIIDDELNKPQDQINQELYALIENLPVSDGTDIDSGKAYIDSTDRCVKVKA